MSTNMPQDSWNVGWETISARLSTLLIAQTLMQFYQHPSRQCSTKTKSKGSTLSSPLPGEKRNTINRPRLEKGLCQATHIFVNFKTRNRIPRQSCREEILHSPTRSSITSAHIRLDTRCLAHIAKELNILTGTGKDLVKDPDLVWSSLFD